LFDVISLSYRDRCEALEPLLLQQSASGSLNSIAGAFRGQVSARHFCRHDCANRTLLNRTGSNRQGNAFAGDCGGSKYSRSRIAPIELVFSCMGSVEAMFLLMSASRSIGVGFAIATVLNAENNAATIKGLIGLASLLNARGNHRNRAPFRTDNHIGVNAIAR
jgi:hypothetical protein